MGIIHNSKCVPSNQLRLLNDAEYRHLSIARGEGVIGYRAKLGIPDPISFGAKGSYPVDRYWSEVYAEDDGTVILHPGEFYIFASEEFVSIPESKAGIMVPYDTRVGEFRSHYAGFFDSGFGSDGQTKAVFEIGVNSVSFRAGAAPVSSLCFIPTDEPPDKLYSASIGSSYQGQGLCLAKQFETV
jgi:dCTP deaminase